MVHRILYLVGLQTSCIILHLSEIPFAVISHTGTEGVRAKCGLCPEMPTMNMINHTLNTNGARHPHTWKPRSLSNKTLRMREQNGQYTAI
jgi:hypothetical protein